MPARLALMLLLGFGSAMAQTGAGELDVGAEVPPLVGVDTGGVALDWQRFAGRAVLLCFHAADSRSATDGLAALAMQCAASPQLAERIALLVVTDGDPGAAAVRDVLAKSALQHAITIDPERRGYPRYHAVAFPTVFAIDAERRIVHVVRGPGPLAAVKACAAARLAAGLVDRAGFERALQPARQPKVERSGRVATLVEELLARGSAASARKLLDGALAETPGDARLLELAVRVELAAGDATAGARRVEELEQAIGQSPRTRWLRVELLLAQGDAAAALAAAEGMPVATMRTALLKGDALSRLGRHEEAAAVYRQALLHEMRQSGGR